MLRPLYKQVSQREGVSQGPTSWKKEHAGALRSHQKGHMNVYYIEKRERKKKFLKPYFQDLKKHKLGMPKRCHALYIYNQNINMYTEICTHRFRRSCTLFPITRMTTGLELGLPKLAEHRGGRDPALRLQGL